MARKLKKDSQKEVVEDGAAVAEVPAKNQTLARTTLSAIE